MQKIANEIRGLTLKCVASLGSGHIGGSLSIVDVLTILYYKHMNVDPKNPQKEGRDRLVCSKGHAGPAVYAALAHKGYFDVEELETLNKFGTNLPSHCDMNKTPGVDMTTGSLGQGISCAVGLAVGSKIVNDGAQIYCIIGDGESQEGQVWEAAAFAAHQKLDNFTVFVDYNKLQLDDYLSVVQSEADIVGKWKSFGFNTLFIDGHDFEALDSAIQCAKNTKGQPTAIILDTVKGKGAKFVEDAKTGNHSMAVTKQDVENFLKEVGE